MTLIRRLPLITIMMMLRSLIPMATASHAQGHNTPIVAWGTISTKTLSAHQAAYRLAQSNDVMMNLAGTTPIRNWNMTAHGLSGEAQMVVSSHDGISNIRSLHFSLPVHNLKGDGDGMDNDAYKALKADKFPTIDFQLHSATIQGIGNGSYGIAATGNLSVAGVTREVVLNMTGTVEADGTIQFHGSEVVKMSDYNVERPSLLMGLIKAGDAMMLTYQLVFVK